MHISQRIKAFSTLGLNLESFVNNFSEYSTDETQEMFHQKIRQAKAKNGWFDSESQLFAFKSWTNALQQKNLEKWTSSYNFTDSTPKTVGIITAGNIPMVGFHDILSVLMSGHIAQIKLSSNDNILIPFILDLLIEIEPIFKDKVQIVEKLTNFDAVIATGSDNTARYFESYFKNVPCLIRKNRTSVAVLNGDETEGELKGLAKDILQYYGLGCRNVTKLYLPKGYDLNQIFKPLFDWKNVINHHKYANNYDYHKAIYMMKDVSLIENGFLLMKEDNAFFSPISTVFYEYYENIETVNATLTEKQDKIQCIVGNNKNLIPFGKAQTPELWDYADNIDTLAWLTE